MKFYARAALALLVSGAGQAKLSSTAYRVLGQRDLRQNGTNRVEGVEMNIPSALALDVRAGRSHLYVADANNHRILAWRDARTFQNGDAPELILGQSNRSGSAPFGIGPKGLLVPGAVTVDPLTGNLYVGDTGNHRVLRFPSPFDAPGQEPDAVYGQPDFLTTAATQVSQTNLRLPRALAFDLNGNLWIADSGFHRVLRYPAATLDAVNPVPDLVLGQADFISGAANRGRQTVSAESMSNPLGLVFDGQNNLYVADSDNARVLRFAAPLIAGAPAIQALGQVDLNTRILPAQPSATSMSAPAGLAIDSSGRLYVAVPAENRVLVFTVAGTPSAASVLGQPDFAGGRANSGTYPLASASSLATPADVEVDPSGNVYIADAGNNRVLAYPPNSRSASRVLGQFDFSLSSPNQAKATGLNAPFKMAIDYSQAPYPLYVSDTRNHRILVWRNSVQFRSGDPADLVIGQPNMRTAIANMESVNSRPAATSLSSPKGIALDDAGNLYVADSGNNRVLRYPRPVDQSGRITPDMVLGQRDFNSADFSLVSGSSLRSPTAVAIGPSGQIFVSDSGNNRVLEFAAGAGPGAAAYRVFGQPDFASSTAPLSPSMQTLSSPQGIAVDRFLDLFIADAGAHRVVGFVNVADAPAAGAVASIVIGSDSFDVPGGDRTNDRLNSPADVGIDQAGRIYVSDAGNHRILEFPSLLFLEPVGATATSVIGQANTNSGVRNFDAQGGLASAKGLSAPAGIFLDRRNTLYVADAGNSRVVHFLQALTVLHPANAQATALGRGALATLQGDQLAEAEAAGEPPLPNALANREVVLNEVLKAPILSVTPKQIGFQVPWLTSPGAANLAIRYADTGELVAGASVAISTYAPGLFAQGGILNEDGSRNSLEAPASRGSTVRILGTGQGQLNPFLGDGQAAPGDQGAVTVAVPVSDGAACLTQQPSVCVAIGSVFGEIKYSGVAAGQVGIWQLDVRIPTSASPGPAIPLRAVIGGVPSNIITIAIR